jgi:serine/threonine-protein kinase
MTDTPWATIRRIFEDLIELPTDRRAAALDAACQDDEELRAEVQELLRADAGASEQWSSSASDLHLRVLEGEELERVGSHLDEYHLLEVIGRGATATVFRARSDDGREVAVKVLRSGFESGEWIGRFRAECQVLQGLEHPGILQVLAAGQTPDERPYLVTEYVAGVALDRYCRGEGPGGAPAHRAVALSGRLELFIRICEAVHHAHSCLVVHRDLKPSNIFVTANGEPKILDFGIAKLLDPLVRTATWTRPGERGPMTPRYASPEQVRGGAVTTASDVHSLGVVLCEVLSGTYAEPDASPTERLPSRLLRGRGGPALPYDARALEGDLDAIVRCACEPRPEDRYSSARHFAEDLRRYLRREPIQARAIPWFARAARFATRNPLLTGSVALFIGPLLFGWWVAERSLERVRASESIAWRAHAEAVYVTLVLADVLEDLGSGIEGNAAALERVARRAEARIETEMVESPEAEGRLRHALARLFAQLGHWGEAEAQARRALDLARSTRGLSKQDVRRNLALLVEIGQKSGLADWDLLLEEWLECCREQLGPEHADTLEATRLAEHS